MLSFEVLFCILLIATVAFFFVILYITEPYARASSKDGEKKLLSIKPQTDSPKCPYGFGYLKKRDKNAPIPDECLSCPRMLECFSSSE